MKINFKDFLFNENKLYLTNRIGDILAACQELRDNSDGMGNRQLTANLERIVNQIRRILHSNWSEKEKPMLLKLQKVGVAIAKSLDEKSDLNDLIPKVCDSLESLTAGSQEPVHSIGVPEEDQKS